MKKILLTVALICLLTVPAGAARAPDIFLDGQPYTGPAYAENGTTYVALRHFYSALLPSPAFAWQDGSAVATHPGLRLELSPGRPYAVANGRALYLPGGPRLQYDTTYVPLRLLAKAADAQVVWDAAAGAARITRGSGALKSGDDFYDHTSLYWLSRIISAESRGEPLPGKIAVGNVVLNRVAHPDFPDSIYGVIFDGRYGGQFEPVRNGTVYDAPTADSVLAAKLVLDGANVAGDSLYFLAPHLTNNHWIMENRTFVTTIGVHYFYI